MSSTKESLTKEEKQELLQIIELLELQELAKLKKKRAARKGIVKRTSAKRNKQKQKFVNQLQKNIAKEYDINIPKPAPKSISKSYGK